MASDEEANQINFNQPRQEDLEHVQIPVKEFKSKFNSKAEQYKFLTLGVKVYLPPEKLVSSYWVGQLYNSKASFITSKEVKHITVPHYETLTVKLILAFAFEYQGMRLYFPEDHEIEKLPREWICNVIYSVIGKPFLGWVEARIEKRNDEAVKKADGHLAMDPRIAAAFRASNHVSKVRGKAVDMMKVGAKRKRTKKQVKADKEEAEQAEQERARKLQRLEELEEQAAAFEAAKEEKAQLEKQLALQSRVNAQFQRQVQDGYLEFAQDGTVLPTGKSLPNFGQR